MNEQKNESTLAKKGGISVETAHIFPVIKKWLYSEKDIFLRELVSNAADAVTKHKRLCSLGQAESDGFGPQHLVFIVYGVDYQGI